jgi:hypothetical protein
MSAYLKAWMGIVATAHMYRAFSANKLVFMIGAGLTGVA